MTKIVLLDIDGVLVQPADTRRGACRVESLCRLMELPNIDITEEKFTELEKRGLSASGYAPITTRLIMNEILSRRPIQDLPDDLISASVSIRRHLDGYLPCESPSAVRAGPAIIHPRPRCKTDALRHSSGTAAEYFESYKDVHRSQTTRLFQQYSLEAAASARPMTAAEIETESFLLMHDRSNINDAIRANCVSWNISLCIHRASIHPPREVNDSHLDTHRKRNGARTRGADGNSAHRLWEMQYVADLRGIDPYALLKRHRSSPGCHRSAWSGEELPLCRRPAIGRRRQAYWRSGSITQLV